MSKVVRRALTLHVACPSSTTAMTAPPDTDAVGTVHAAVAALAETVTEDVIVGAPTNHNAVAEPAETLIVLLTPAVGTVHVAVAVSALTVTGLVTLGAGTVHVATAESAETTPPTEIL